MQSVAVSLVLYNTPHLEVNRCIELILLSELVEVVYVVDNSPNRTEGFCSYEKVIYIHTAKNVGYGRAHNLAINHCKNDADYHLVMNTDIHFDISVLSSLTSIMAKNPNIGLVTPNILDVNNVDARNMKYCPSAIQLIARLLPDWPFVVGVKDSLIVKYPENGRFILVPYVSGSFMFFNARSLKEIDCFDERFFMYPEDIDISRRMIEKFDVVCVRDLFVTHEHRAESKKSFKMFTIHAFNMIKYFNKWGWFIDKKRQIINKRVDEVNKEGSLT